MEVDPVLGEVDPACDVEFDEFEKEFFAEVFELGFWDGGDGVKG